MKHAETTMVEKNGQLVCPKCRRVYASPTLTFLGTIRDLTGQPATSMPPGVIPLFPPEEEPR
jgi:hypothetical protein